MTTAGTHKAFIMALLPRAILKQHRKLASSSTAISCAPCLITEFPLKQVAPFELSSEVQSSSIRRAHDEYLLEGYGLYRTDHDAAAILLHASNGRGAAVRAVRLKPDT